MATYEALQVSAKPMSVQEISKKAENFEYNPQVPLKYWLRTADTLLKEAAIYEREGSDQQAYLLLFRHAKLVLDHLSKHPDRSDPRDRRNLILTEKALPQTLAKLEALKPGITRRHERHQAWIQARSRDRDTASSTASTQARPESRGSQNQWDPSFPDRPPSHGGGGGGGNIYSVSAADHQDLAVRMAHKEIQRRETARRAVRQAGVSEAEEQERRGAGDWANWEQALAKDDGAAGDENEIRRRIERTRRRMDEVSFPKKRHEAKDGAPESRGTDYRYPLVPPVREGDVYSQEPPPLPPQRSTASPPPNANSAFRPPSLPPKPSAKEPPARPEKRPASHASASSDSARSDPPHYTFTFRPSATLENGTPLRTIFLPPTLRTTFLSIAAPNTKASLETCGILCGTLISNALFVSRLVIPEQINSSDTCETVNESALFDYCDSEDLMVLGWIHTHPTQTCFMSSRDLHTHCGYQVMMPESIAIVCAPSKTPSWGIFRLTDPPGMRSVLNCTQTGLFHPHAERDIYTDALRPGHVFEARGLNFEVVDLRPKKGGGGGGGGK